MSYTRAASITMQHKLSIDDNHPLTPTLYALTHEPHNPDFEPKPADGSTTSSDSWSLPDYSHARPCQVGGGNLSLYSKGMCLQALFRKENKNKTTSLCVRACAWPGTGQRFAVFLKKDVVVDLINVLPYVQSVCVF